MRLNRKHAVNSTSAFTLVAAILLVAFVVAGCGSSSKASSERFDRSNWDALATDPDAHKGAKVEFVGRVFSAPERDKKGVYLQVWEDPKNSENNTIVAYAQPTFAVNDDDYVHVTGTVKSKFTGANAFGAKVTVPLVVADDVKVVDATAAAPPAINTYDGPATDIQAGVTLLIHKVEFAASETRVYVTIKNASDYDASVFTSSMKIVQGTQQHEASFSSDYPEPSSDVLAGASTSGVIVFPTLLPHNPIKIVVDGSTENTDAGSYGSLTFTINMP